MTVSRVIIATMLFLQFVLYSSSFVDTLKNEITGAALELWQLKIKQFSSEILKFITKQKNKPFTWTILWFLELFCLYFMQAWGDWVLIVFGTQVIKKNIQFSSRFQPMFPFLMTMVLLISVQEWLLGYF